MSIIYLLLSTLKVAFFFSPYPRQLELKSELALTLFVQELVEVDHNFPTSWPSARPRHR